MKVITLCGSTKFKEKFEQVNRELTLLGDVVLTCGAFKEDVPDIEKYRMMLEEIQRKKIDLSDSIFVINPGGYIGEHTQRDIDYARSKEKEVTYLEVPWDKHICIDCKKPQAGKAVYIDGVITGYICDGCDYEIL